MKKTLLTLVALSALAFGADYTAMSATELSALKGTVPTEGRPAFQAALQEKMATMTKEERQTMTQTRTSNPGTGSMGSNAGSGAGTGSGKGGGNGNGGKGGKR